MILAHTIVGLMPVDNSQFSWYWLAGSVIPDVDHSIFSKLEIVFTIILLGVLVYTTL